MNIAILRLPSADDAYWAQTYLCSVFFCGCLSIGLFYCLVYLSTDIYRIGEHCCHDNRGFKTRLKMIQSILCWGICYCRRRPASIICSIRRLWQGTELRRIPFFRHLRSSTFPVKVHMLVAGETFQVHETFMQKLKLQIELCSAESSSVILVFCPVVSRIGTDMEAAMARVPEDKPVILVFMHHCHHPSHMTNITVQPSRSNIVIVVHCAFHQHEGLLRCDENNKAVDMVCSELKKHQ